MKGWVNKVKKNKFEIDMCNGSIMDKLISFSLPLMVSGCASWNGIFSSPDGAFSDRNGGNKNCVGIWNFSEPQIFIRTFCILSGVMDHYHCTSGRVLLFCEKKGTSERKKIVINRTKL